MICNEEDTDGRARVTTDEERVTEWRSDYLGSQVFLNLIILIFKFVIYFFIGLFYLLFNFFIVVSLF